MAIGAVVSWWTFKVGTIEESDPTTPPCLVCPTQLNLGPHEIRTTATGNLHVTNNGGQLLVIDKIQSSCACTGLEKLTPEGPRRIDILKIKPGESVALQVRINLNGKVGEPLTQAITFRTNDPSRLEFRLLLVIPMLTGGVRTDPAEVAFGSVPVGNTAEKIVGIYDPSVTTRSIRTVKAFPEDRTSVELLPPVTPDPNTTPPPGVLIGRLRIRVHSSVAGPIDGKVVLTLDEANREPDIIPVSARMVGRIDVIPSNLVLPLATGGNQMVYRGTFSCSARDGKPFILNVESCPEGFAATVSDAQGQPGSKYVVIELKPGALPPRQTEKQNLILHAVVGEENLSLSIPVLC
jgi:hypothetical protein